MSLTVIPFSSSYSIRTKVRRVGTLPHAGNVGCSNCQAERVLPTRSCHRAYLFSWAPPLFFLCVCVCSGWLLMTCSDLQSPIHSIKYNMYTQQNWKLACGCRYLLRNDVWLNPESRWGLYKNQRLAQSTRSLCGNPEGSPAALHTSTPSLLEALSPSLSTWPTVPSMKLAKDLGTCGYCGSSKVWVWLCLLSHPYTRIKDGILKRVHSFLDSRSEPKILILGWHPIFCSCFVLQYFALPIGIFEHLETQILPLSRMIGSDQIWFLAGFRVKRMARSGCVLLRPEVNALLKAVWNS